VKPPRRQADARRPEFYATHRVRVLGPGVDDVWQRFNTVTEDWEGVAYDDVPDEIWPTGFRRDGFRFYTDRTRPIERRG
jgi:hypothetical protein